LQEKVLDQYSIEVDGLFIAVKISQTLKEFVRIYSINAPKIGKGSNALLENLKNSIISEVPISSEKLLDKDFFTALRQEFHKKANSLFEKETAVTNENDKKILIYYLLNDLIGLGEIEILLLDPNLEEVVINSSKEPIWVYHKNYGWLKTSIFIDKEEAIQNYAAIIARRVGKQISVLNPMLDAHLISGDRANATLFPISSSGNTLTIRRFKRTPWTVTDFISNNTVSSELMALLWSAIQFELNIIISGGTASGKTSFLNVLMPFVQANNRVITIEDTRELSLPQFLHWIPLTTREPNPEGKGGISMLDLMVNALRMRPDRMVVGEIRRQSEVEVLFEAMQTGHSGYTTIHANTAEETIRRITNPPLNLPASSLNSIHLNAVMFRNRRTGTRHVYQLAEYIPEKRGERALETVVPNILYRYSGATKKITKYAEPIRLFEELELVTGSSNKEILQDLKEKESILNWMVSQKISDISVVGKIINRYYLDENEILNYVNSNRKLGEDEI